MEGGIVKILLRIVDRLVGRLNSQKLIASLISAILLVGFALIWWVVHSAGVEAQDARQAETVTKQELDNAKQQLTLAEHLLTDKQQYVARGVLHDFSPTKTLTSHSVYLLKSPGGGQLPVDDWKFVLLERTNQLELYTGTPAQGSKESVFHRFYLSIPGAYDNATELQWTLEGTCLKGTPPAETVCGQALNQAGDPKASDKHAPQGGARSWLDRWFSLTSVLAQSVDLSTIKFRLESDDIIERLTARSDLAMRGKESLSFIQNVLSDDTSSYRLRLGSLVALNKMITMKLIEPTSASLRQPRANCAIVLAASSHSDEILADEASTYLKSLKDRAGMPTEQLCRAKGLNRN